MPVMCASNAAIALVDPVKMPVQMLECIDQAHEIGIRVAMPVHPLTGPPAAVEPTRKLVVAGSEAHMIDPAPMFEVTDQSSC